MPRRGGADSSTPYVMMILLVIRNARELSSRVYHPGYNATTVAELSSNVYAERDLPIEKSSVHAHKRFTTTRIDNVSR